MSSQGRREGGGREGGGRRKRLSIEEYNSRLPDNLSFTKLNKSNEKSPLKCSLCGYENESWSMYLKSASRNTKCPSCKNMPDKLKILSEKLPSNLEYIEYTNENVEAKYKCNLCNNINSMIPKNKKGVVKCKYCKNTGMSSIERLNEDLANKKPTCCFKYIAYTNSYKKADVQCLKCSHIWEIIPKNINTGIKNTNCSMCDTTIKEDEFDQFLNDNYLMSETLPVIPRSVILKHEFVCKLCESKVSKSMKKITNGQVCDFCAKNRTKNDSLRCQAFADKNSIEFALQGTNQSDYYYSWTCREGHTINKLSLAGMKRKILDMDRSNRTSWCDKCENPSEDNPNRPQTIAESKGWQWGRGVNGYINDNSRYQFECNEGHKFIFTINEIINEHKECPECDSIIVSTVKNLNFSHGMDEELEKDIDIEMRKQNREQKREDLHLYKIEKERAQKSIREYKRADVEFKERQDKWFNEIEYGTDY